MSRGAIFLMTAMRILLQLTGAAVLILSGVPVFASETLTPPGITLQVLGKGQGYDLGKQSAAALPRDRIAFADARGMTLYTHRNDPPGKSACTDACAKSWLPAVAPTDAQTGGAWSVVTRADGKRQWAYKDKPLYTYVKDVDPGSVGGNSPARFGARRKNGAGVFVGGGIRGSGAKGGAAEAPLPADWKVALAYPVTDIRMPAGFAVKEVADAAAFALVDWRGRTLYALDEPLPAPALDCQRPCAWQPAAAPQLAEAMGDFFVVGRDDGIKQWAYKGRALYTFAGDLAPGDANGTGAHPKLAVAAVAPLFMPAGVTLRRSLNQGYVLTTAQGMTLYRRDGYIFQSGGGHSLHRGQPPRPAVGRDIGTDAHCEGQCASEWHPLAAPADARPQGFWDVATRPDGTKQWVYQGYALWTYDGDKKPGDLNGNDTFMYAFSDLPHMHGAKAPLDFGTPMDGAPALYWAIAIP